MEFVKMRMEFINAWEQTRRDFNMTNPCSLWQPWKKDFYQNKEVKLSNKELPTTKWRRDRRIRLSEYHSQSSQMSGNNKPLSPESRHNMNNGEAPLDMTLTGKPRSPPPPYREPLPGSNFATTPRPSVITQAPKRDLPETSASISMIDPVIDEHFRRSLGDDYMVLFSKNNSKKVDSIPSSPVPVSSPTPPKMPTPSPPPTPPIKAAIITKQQKSPSSHPQTTNTTTTTVDSDMIGMSVDDHFAKALGETWKKIKEENGQVGKIQNKKDSIRPCVQHEVV